MPKVNAPFVLTLVPWRLEVTATRDFTRLRRLKD